jgi:hypothetical protein
MGDRLRTEAAALLYHEVPQLVVASGGKGKQAHVPDAPTCASVLRRELSELGVAPADILDEAGSANTYEQLQAINSLFAQFRLKSLRIVSNRWHLPRVDAFLKDDARFRAWQADGHIQLQAAEGVLLRHDPSRWSALITEAYNSPAMQQRIADEERGIRDIRAGTYILS